MAQDSTVPHVTPEMFGWTPETDPVETASIINRTLAAAVERGVPYFDNAPRRIAGTVRLGGKVVMEFGTKHRWIADYRDLSRFSAVQENLAKGVTAEPRHVFVDTAGARGSIIRGPFRLTGALPKNMTLAERGKIPASLVALTATSAAPSSQITVEQLTVEGFGFGFYQGSQRNPGRNNLPYTRMQVGTAIFRFCGTAIETGEWGNGLDDATFQILRISRCANTAILRGTDLNAMSVFSYGLRPTEDSEDAVLYLSAGSDQAEFSGIAPRRGMVVAILPSRDRPGFVARVDNVEGQLAVLSHAPEEDYQGAFMVDPPSLIAQNSAVNAMHFYLEGAHDLPLALRAKSKASIRDFKISRGSFTSRGGTPVAIMGPQTGVELEMNPRSVENPMVAGMVGLMSDNASVGGRIVSGARLANERGGVLDTRPLGRRARGQPSSQIEGFFADTSGSLRVESR